MKKSDFIRTASMWVLLWSVIWGISAQDVTTVEATNADISEHLNLEAVASAFGDSRDLEDFEQKLNDPELHLSNLDLNNDGYVDYLRVVEHVEGNTHLILIQAVLDKDVYQDVATVEVEKDNDGVTRVQVVGDVYMYGEDYIVEPVYVHRPVIFINFWRPYYRPYYSVYYWGYWPPYWYYWHPYRIDVYHHYVYHHCINYNYTFHYTHHRRSHVAVNLHRRYRRNDYGRRYPKRSFTHRRGVKRMDLDKIRRRDEKLRRTAMKNSEYKIKPASKVARTKPAYRTGRELRNKPATRPASKPANKATARPSSNKPVSKPAYRTGRELRSKPATRPASKPAGKPVSRPANKPTGRPAARPANRPSSKPTTRPASRPVSKPTSKPVTRPANKPVSRPAARPAVKEGNSRGSHRSTPRHSTKRKSSYRSVPSTGKSSRHASSRTGISRSGSHSRSTRSRSYASSKTSPHRSSGRSHGVRGISRRTR